MKLPLIALCLLSFILINAVEANYKKDYCGNKEYVLRGDRYPHLHCGKGFFTLSYKRGQHVNFVDNGVVCSRVNKVLGSPCEYNNFNKFPAILKAIQKFNKEECQQLFQESNKNEELLKEEDPYTFEEEEAPMFEEQGPMAEESVSDNNKNRMNKEYNTEDDEEQEYRNERKPNWKQEREYYQDDDDDDDGEQEYWNGREEEYKNEGKPDWN